MLRNINTESVDSKCNGEFVHSTSFSRNMVKSIVQVKKRIREIAENIQEDIMQDDRQPVYIIPGRLSSLIDRTGLSREEIQQMYRAFKQYCPRGTLTTNNLKPAYAKLFPLGDASKYSHIVFNAFDKDRDGVVGFEDLLAEISSIINGTIDQKLSWIFGFYDLNGDGYITRYEMLMIISATYEMVYDRQTFRPIIDRHVDRVFQKMDTDKDGLISREEFMTCCKNDEQIHDQLIMFNKFW